MSSHVFTGFGFGPIQSGLFVSEAFKSGNFKRIVIAEIDQDIVDAVRNNNGSYFVNVATRDSIIAERIEGVEIYNPTVDADREQLLGALAESTEIVTSLPSVKFYDMGQASVAKLIAEGLKDSTAAGTIIYTAENNNHAAEELEKVVSQYVDLAGRNVQFLNTVIGKMSQVTTDAEMITHKKLKTIVPGFTKAFLVEEFNHILVTETELEDFTPGINVFVEKKDLLPFEEAKLYGHNAIHALLAYLGLEKGFQTMDQLRADTELMQVARDAFINESGGALIKKYADLNDELFTEPGHAAFADDLLERMTNPFLSDSIERAARDPLRKLGPNDRIFGTMALAIRHGIEPVNLAKGAAAGIAYMQKRADEFKIPAALCADNYSLLDSRAIKFLEWIWGTDKGEHDQQTVKSWIPQMNPCKK
jgi:mannitol-1-phosphate 5-dehydrogenase